MNIAAVVAGGTGTRMENVMPKQFLPLNGKPVLCHSLSTFLEHPRIDFVIIGTHSDYIPVVGQYKKEFFSNNAKIIIAHGGCDRNETLLNILRTARTQCNANDDTVIVSHDAARPFLTAQTIDDALNEISDCDAVCTAVPAVDTTVIVKNGKIEAFPDRSNVFRLQTPQTFRLGMFEKVYASLSPEQRAVATDVSRLFFECGKRVKFTAGNEKNIKITYPQDIALAETIFRQ